MAARRRGAAMNVEKTGVLPNEIFYCKEIAMFRQMFVNEEHARLRADPRTDGPRTCLARSVSLSTEDDLRGH